MTAFFAIAKAAGLMHILGMKEIIFAIILVGLSRSWFNAALSAKPYSTLSSGQKIRLFFIDLLVIPLLFVSMTIWFSTLVT